MKTLVELCPGHYVNSCKDSVLRSEPTFFQELMPQLDSPVFALDFRDRGSNSSSGPSMEMGRIDHAKYIGELAQSPIDNSTNRWIANVNFSIRGQLMNESANLVFGEYS